MPSRRDCRSAVRRGTLLHISAVALLAPLILRGSADSPASAADITPPAPIPPATRIAATQPSTQATPARTGSFTLTFTDRSPLSATPVITDRLGWTPGVVRGPSYSATYQLSNETFDVYVPDTYTGEKPFGLVVYISPGGGGSLAGLDRRRGWRAVIDRHELIWVGPGNVGNNRPVIPRLGIAIDAAVNMQSRFKIDPERVYVMGVSGGGRVSSMLGVAFPDVFRGGLYMIGCDFYWAVHSREQNGAYARSYYPPPKPLLDVSKRRSKHVLLTGDFDPNRDQTSVNFDAFKRDGFKHCTYFQVPDMGHEPPPQDWFEKAIAALDERLPPEPEPQTKPAKPTAARAGPATRPAGPTTRPVASPRPVSPSGVEADRLLAAARLYAENRMYGKAREKLRELLERHPNTPAGREGKQMLAELAEKR